MQPAKMLAWMLALCLLISIVPASLAEADLTIEPMEEIEEEVAPAESLDGDNGLVIDDGTEPVPEEAAPEAIEEPEVGAVIAAAATANYSYFEVGGNDIAVYSQGDTWEASALLHAGDVVLVTGMAGDRASVAFCADDEVLVGYMELSDLLPMDEGRVTAYLDKAAAADMVMLYNGDLDWPLLPLANVTYGDDREVLASSNYNDLGNDTVFKLNGKEIYANMVPDTGSGNCWRWAQGIYQLAWGCRFSENFKGNDSTGLNLLGNLNDAQRKLSPAHLRAFISNTTPGATIRVCGCTSECKSFNNDGLSCGHNGHSLIVVDKNADGVFTMDSHSNSQHTRFYSWQGFCNAWKNYPYVKYIKWPGAKPLPANSISEDGSGVSVTGVSLSETSITINVGETVTLKATVTPANATDQTVSWASSDAGVASVNGGSVTGVKAGTATIAVKTNDGGRTATCTVTVKKPIQQKALTKTGGNGTVVLALGDQLQLSADFATNRGWQLKGVKTSKAKVAGVNESGLVTAVGVGKAKITVATKNKKKATVTIQVVDPTVPAAVALNKKGTIKLKVGDKLKLEAAILPTTATTTFTWKSSKPKVATVDQNGNVVALKKGSATIAVRTANGKLAKVKIKVSKK